MSSLPDFPAKQVLARCDRGACAVPRWLRAFIKILPLLPGPGIGLPRKIEIEM